MKRWTLRLFAVAIALTACACRDDTWVGIVYPNRDELLVHREIGTYSSVADCRTAAKAYLSGIAATRGDAAGDYECGKNCRQATPEGVRICEETAR